VKEALAHPARPLISRDVLKLFNQDFHFENLSLMYGHLQVEVKKATISEIFAFLSAVGRGWSNVVISRKCFAELGWTYKDGSISFIEESLHGKTTHTVPVNSDHKGLLEVPVHYFTSIFNLYFCSSFNV
jgi:hypothetical protein